MSESLAFSRSSAGYRERAHRCDTFRLLITYDTGMTQAPRLRVAAEQPTILLVEQQVGGHRIGQARRECRPSRAEIECLIDADIGGDPDPLEIRRIDHYRIDGMPGSPAVQLTQDVPPLSER